MFGPVTCRRAWDGDSWLCFVFSRRKLKRFAECLLRLVMLVAVPFVEPVCPLADHVRSHVLRLAAVPSRPLLGGFQELRARSGAALPFRNNQPVHFGSDI